MRLIAAVLFALVPLVAGAVPIDYNQVRRPDPRTPQTISPRPPDPVQPRLPKGQVHQPAIVQQGVGLKQPKPGLPVMSATISKRPSPMQGRPAASGVEAAASADEEPMLEAAAAWSCNWWGGQVHTRDYDLIYTTAYGSCDGVQPAWEHTLRLDAEYSGISDQWSDRLEGSNNWYMQTPLMGPVQNGDEVYWRYWEKITVPEGYYWNYLSNNSYCYITNNARTVLCDYYGEVHVNFPQRATPTPTATPVPTRTPTPMPLPNPAEHPECPGFAAVGVIPFIPPTDNVVIDELYVLQTSGERDFVRIERELWVQNIQTGYNRRFYASIPMTNPAPGYESYWTTYLAGRGTVVASIQALATLDNGAQCLFYASGSMNN